MCDPMTLASVALSAGGAYYNGQTQANYVNAVNKANNDAYLMSKQAREAELVRQKALEDQSAQSFSDALATAGRDNADATTANNARTFTDTMAAAAKPAAAEVGFLLPGQGESSVAVKDWVARTANTAAQDASKRIAALANMTGASSAAGDRLTAMGRAQDEVSTNNGIRRGSLGVSQLEQNIPAANVTPGSTLLGDLLSGAGMLAGAGAFGGGLFNKPLSAVGRLGSTARAGTSLLPTAYSGSLLPSIY